MKRRQWLLVAISVLLLLAAGFLIARWRAGESLVDADQIAHEEGWETALEPGRSLGQTFVARHGGLAGIELFLLPENSTPLSLTLHLRTDPQSDADLVKTSLELSPEATPGFYRFSFPPIMTSHGQYYYAFVDAARAGVSLGLADGDRYLDGAAYQAGEPLDAQVTFRLVYSPGLVVLDLFRATLGWLGLLVVAGLLFVVPGWALLAWLLPERRLRWAEMLGLSAGLSLALYPLLLLWTHIMGLNMGALYAWLPSTLGLVALIWRYRRWKPKEGWSALEQWARSEALWPDLTLLVVLALVFGVRFLVVRTLEAPMWGDSYQHTVMAQLMLDQGGLFDSWEPLTPYRSLTVHFGFPTAAALLAWATGISSVQATLLTGQLVNGLAALTLYPLSMRIADGNRWAGVGAVLAAGMVSHMPAFYVNWGRYAQLTGQVILPVALWLMWEVIQNDGSPWKATILAGCAAAGMTLNYYRMPFYYAVFVLAWLLAWGLPRWGTEARLWLKGGARLTMIAGIALLLLVPLALRVSGGRLAAGLGTGIAAGSPLERVLADYRMWLELHTFVPPILLVAALIALIWSLVRRQWIVLAVGLWVLGTASLVAGRLIHLPGANYMDSFAILIALYVPVGLLVGWLVGQVADLLKPWTRQWVLGLALLAIAGWAAAPQLRIVELRHVMVTHPDARAMVWIQQNTPREAQFLIEGFRVHGGHSIVGADAGWWIPLFTGRQNTVPPEYALLNEAPAQPGYTQRLVDLVARLETTSPTSPEGMELLCDYGITHVYVGQGQGQVGADAVQLFSRVDLANSPAFDQVYSQDRVSIFALNPQVCGVGT